MADPLDAAALAAIRERCQRATPGPWVLWDGCSWRRLASEATDRTILEPTKASDGHPDLLIRNRADVDFILAARTDLPRLLDAYTHQQEQVALVPALRAYEQTHDIDAREWGDPACGCPCCVEADRLLAALPGLD